MRFPVRALSLMATLAVSAAPQMGVAQQNSEPQRVEFQEMSFQLPGAGWKGGRHGNAIVFDRSDEPSHRVQTLSAWPVRPNASFRGRSKQEHTALYFEFERHQERPAKASWDHFTIRERRIGSSQYPTMNFQVTYATSPPRKEEGLFVLYFPDDFEVRQSFYCLMWTELFPADEKQGNLDLQMIDSVVSSLRIGALATREPVEPTAPKEKVQSASVNSSSLIDKARAGDTKAQGELAEAYLQGNGIPQSDSEAFQWFQKAAQSGDPLSQANLGAIYGSGRGTAVNYSKALEWYGKAARQGNSSGQYGLGVLYENAQGVPRDYKKAIEWWRKAADQGHVVAEHRLATAYGKGQGVKRDDAEAVRWCQKAAEEGFAPAQNDLGSLYRDGQGVSSDFTQALLWFRKAAAQGYSSAQYNLGLVYYQGQGVERDTTEAARLFRQAAEQGDPYAQYMLGGMYANGDGLPKDKVSGYMWLLTAKILGHPGAEKVLEQLDQQLNSEERAEANNQSIKHLEAYLRYVQRTPDRTESIAQAYEGLGSLHEALGREKTALEKYEEGLQASPDSPILLNQAAWLYATAKDPQVRNPQKALDYATRAVARSPGEMAFLDTLAEAYFINGRIDEAIKNEKKAISLNRDNKLLKEQLKKFETAKKSSPR